MEEQHAFGLLLTNIVVQVVNANPSKALTLAKYEPQLLQTHALQSWEHTQANDKDVCVIGFDYDRFAPLSCSISGMDKDAAVCLLMRTFVQFSQTHFVCAKCLGSLGHNNQVWCRHLDNLICQGLKMLTCHCASESCASLRE